MFFTSSSSFSSIPSTNVWVLPALTLPFTVPFLRPAGQFFNVLGVSNDSASVARFGRTDGFYLTIVIVCFQFRQGCSRVFLSLFFFWASSFYFQEGGGIAKGTKGNNKTVINFSHYRSVAKGRPLWMVRKQCPQSTTYLGRKKRGCKSGKKLISSTDKRQESKFKR